MTTLEANTLVAIALAVHVLATLMEKGFEPNILPGVLGAFNSMGENWETIILAELVKQHAGNSSRHTPEGYNVDNPVEAVLSIFHDSSHTQNSFSFYCRG